MTTKLSLALDKYTIEKSKLYAKNTGRSLSEIIETYLESLINEQTPNNISMKLQNLIGKVTLPTDFNEKEKLRNILKNKHL